MKLRFSLDQCLGLYNLRLRSFPGEYISDEKGYVELIRGIRMFYGQGYNFYYRWYGGKYYYLTHRGLSFVGIKRMNGTSCYKVNYVNFDATNDVVDGVFDEIIKMVDVKAVVGTRRAETARPSRMSMSFWNMDEELKHFETCFVNGFRFFPDNHNNEPYVLIRGPDEDAWATLAFTGKFALDKTCLIFGGAIHFHVQEVDSYSQCFSKVGGFLYDYYDSIIPKGVCGGILANLHNEGGGFKKTKVSFQRPLIHARCCHLNMFVMSKSIPCIQLATVRRITRLQKEDVSDIYEWSNHINTTSEMFTWRALCTKNIAYVSHRIPRRAFATSSLLEICIIMHFYVFETCDVKIHYRMSLLALAYETITTDSVFSRRMCHGNSCYNVPTMDYTMSWDGAQAKCIQLNGNLVSVNSDAEWKYLTHNIILQRKAFIELIYIGYRTVSVLSRNDRVLNSVIFFAVII